MSSIPISEKYLIQDIREIKEFKTISFTGYKKTDVKHKIMQCLLDSKVEELCYWTAEFITAGHFMECWDICFYFLGKHIHLGNPLMILYLHKKLETFKVIANEQIYQQYPLHLRNNDTIRQMFAEIFSTMALSYKKHPYEELKIHTIADVSHIVNHLRADNSNYAADVMRHNDPSEWTIAINELGYHISQSKNMNLACFWVEWLAEFDGLCRKKKNTLFCEKRIDYTEIESKFRGDFIWIVWETLVFYAQKRGHLEYLLINTLFEFFRVRYTYLAIKKRKPLIYFAISILTETNTCLKQEILSEESKMIVSRAVENIDRVIYQSLKKQEILDQDQMNTRKWEKNQKAMDSIQKMQTLREHDFIVGV